MVDQWLLIQVIRNEYNPEDCPTLDEILAGDAEDTTVDVGFIRQCYINQFFERLQEYDEYRSIPSILHVFFKLNLCIKFFAEQCWYVRFHL